MSLIDRAFREKIVLVGVTLPAGDHGWSGAPPEVETERHLDELALLVSTAGADVVARVHQRRDRPDPATYIGKGKAEDVRMVSESADADTVVFDDELSPAQSRNLEKILGRTAIDRTAVILDIFAQNARTQEGKAQVELAQLEYMLPRLRGWGESLSRQAGGRVAGGGGIGTRGPGETKIETDRRRIRTRTARLRRQLAEMSVGRQVQRHQRRDHAVPAVAIAGYTNAGKSSLLNRMTGAGVLVDDSLFATLDPSVRRARTPSGRWFTLTDTVGFVRHLPHQLVEAFRSTLEEVAEADLILHVVDGSDADPQAQISAVREVLSEIGARDVPELVVINKADAADPFDVDALRRQEPHSVIVSARTGEGLEALAEAVEAALPQWDREVSAVVPYVRGDLVARAHQEGEVLALRHCAAGTELTARVPPGLAAEIDRIAVPAGS
jgi:GTP-binding protein HflX